jgi:hypothetical protein
MIYDPFSNKSFTRDVCFLCGLKLNKKITTKEHIFPQWLINEYMLGTKKLQLIDGSEHGYKQIIIPCCRTCNSTVLGKVERKIRKEFFDKCVDEINLSPKEISLWAGKILYGSMLYEYLYLKKTYGKENDKFLEYADFFENKNTLRILFLFLQSFRFPEQISISDQNLDFPVSFYRYNLKLSREKPFQFNYSNDLNGLAFTMQMGHIGLLIGFDGGYSSLYVRKSLFQRFTEEILHPLQFAELRARFIHLSTIRNYDRIFTLTRERNKIRIEYLPDYFRNPFNEDDTDRYLDILSQYTLTPKEKLSYDNGHILTWLQSETGEFLNIDLLEHPWP